jgi:hypothetical protein
VQRIGSVLSGDGTIDVVARREETGGSRQSEIELDSRAGDGDSGLLCRVHGIPSEDLMVLARKGAKRCP